VSSLDADRAAARQRLFAQLGIDHPANVHVGLQPESTRAATRRTPSVGARDGRRRLWYPLLAAAGVIVCLLGVRTAATHMRAHEPTIVTTYATMDGERANIALPDGSHVMLNVGSRIEIPKRFGDGDRVVRLSGEAYFEVVHTTGAPFTVDVGGRRVTVLGTDFGVRAYSPAELRVAVRSGRVAVGTAVLGANDIARATADGIAVAHRQSLDTALGFVTGRLVLAKTPLRDAIAELDRWYGADIRLGDAALGNLPLQGVLMSGSIGDLMELLQGTLDVRVVRQGKTLTLYPR
jgi:transmembrane sensor